MNYSTKFKVRDIVYIKSKGGDIKTEKEEIYKGTIYRVDIMDWGKTIIQSYIVDVKPSNGYNRFNETKKESEIYESLDEMKKIDIAKHNIAMDKLKLKKYKTINI